MRLPRRSSMFLCIIVASLLALLVANIQQIGQTAGGFYEWTCTICGVSLYCCPGKRLSFLRVPETYEAHVHAWEETHRPPHWSPWKPWQWLAYWLVDDRLLEEQSPDTIFAHAHVDEGRSSKDGLRTLLSDSRYEQR